MDVSVQCSPFEDKRLAEAVLEAGWQHSSSSCLRGRRCNCCLTVCVEVLELDLKYSNSESVLPSARF
jgi:hypothetical protein